MIGKLTNAQSIINQKILSKAFFFSLTKVVSIKPIENDLKLKDYRKKEKKCTKKKAR